MREHWRSGLGFVLATAGFAVGLGNVWRFPYLVGENGGGAFLLVYLAFALLIGIPLLTAEIGLGRRSGLTPIAGMGRLTGSATAPWNLIGWFGVAAAILITAYYVMLIGWILAYLVMILAGMELGTTPAETRRVFEAFTSRPVPVVASTAVVVVAIALIVRRGVQRGIERVARVLMPAFVVLMLGLAARGLTYPGAGAGLSWYLRPDFRALDGDALLAALGQAFFSIGIGMAAAFGLGSYLDPEDSDVPGNAAIVVIFDTAVAVLAGLVIFPMLFAFGMSPDQGPALLFVTMPALFQEMPGGTLFGVAFFFLLLVAGLTSQIALFEVLVASAVDSLGMSRGRAVWIGAMASLLLSVPVILSQGPWARVRFLGMDLFDAADRISSNYLLTLGGLLISLYVAFAWGWPAFRDDINRGSGYLRVGRAWRPLVMVLIPAAVLLVVLSGIGVVG